MLKFKSNLQILRERQGLSQRELGNILGVSTSTIGNYEQGIREPNFEMLEKMADYFNVPIGTLLGDARASRLLMYYDRLSGLIEKAYRLDDADLGRLIERIDTMLESPKYQED